MADLEQALDGDGVVYLARVRQAAARLARRDLSSNDTRAMLAELAEVATIDVDVPTLSRRPPVRAVKKGVKRLGGWYARYLGQQVTSFGLAAVRFGEALIEQTESIERSTDRLASDLAVLAARVKRLEERDSAGRS